MVTNQFILHNKKLFLYKDLCYKKNSIYQKLIANKFTELYLKQIHNRSKASVLYSIQGDLSSIFKEISQFYQEGIIKLLLSILSRDCTLKVFNKKENKNLENQIKIALADKRINKIQKKLSLYFSPRQQSILCCRHYDKELLEEYDKITKEKELIEEDCLIEALTILNFFTNKHNYLHITEPIINNNIIKSEDDPEYPHTSHFEILASPSITSQEILNKLTDTRLKKLEEIIAVVRNSPSSNRGALFFSENGKEFFINQEAYIFLLTIFTINRIIFDFYHWHQYNT